MFIDGWSGQSGIILDDPDRQNWESGIAFTMKRCTFFRNFAGFWAGALQLNNIWRKCSGSLCVFFSEDPAAAHSSGS